MKKYFIPIMIVLSGYAKAQIGIGTTSPNSTLDVRGSLSVAVTTFTVNTTAGSSDNFLLFTGTLARTLTLPTAVGITGRVYWIKNASSNSSILTIATTSAQTIDGLSSWTLAQEYKAIRVVSNGTNWYVASESLPGSGSGTAWLIGGNSVASAQNIGTISNYDFPFITNNTEKMRLSATGNLGIGASSFNGTYPEKLLVDASTTTSVNAIVGKGTINNYLQLNIQNLSSGTSASSDVVATASNGSETTNYVDLGINGGGNTSGVLGTADDAYLYNIGQNFFVGTGTSSKSLIFLTGGTDSATNERMRITGSGNVGIANASPSEKLDVTGNIEFSGALMPGGSPGTVGTFLISTGSSSPPTWFDASGYAWLVNGNSVSTAKTFGTTTNFDLPFITNNTEKMRLSAAGDLGIGTSSFNSTYPEQLLVDGGLTGNTNYQNVIVGKGNTNSYAQLNIQNLYSAAANSASSDVVATSDNGNESVNFVDLGINSGTNTTTGVLGGANTAYLYTTGSNFAIGNGTNSKDILFFTTTAGVYTERMRLTTAGILQPAASNTYDLGTSTLRWRTIYSNNVLNTSDARLKTNIRNLNYGLSTILNMRPVAFNWKEGNDKDKKIGFLAQELRTIIPEVVVGDESKETLAVNYTELIPVLVNAIKEQQKQIDNLRKKIEILERK